MRGVAIHSVDPQTNARLGALISNASAAEMVGYRVQPAL